jgi:pimeloyl-ACP methyl ester carboxylesterase
MEAPTMAEPRLALTRLAGTPGHGDLLVVGPSLGTAVEPLWAAAAASLADGFEVVGWDLPGHGRSEPATWPFSIAELASAVRRLAAPLVGDDGRRASYAGVSLGGAVALELALEPGVFGHVNCIASAARIGDAATWHERAALVRRAGTPVMVAPSSQRWFADGFLERDPATGNRLLLSLADTDQESYALACEALADFDLRPRLGDSRVPLLVAPGECDVVVPPPVAEQTAAAAPGAVLQVLAGCGHLPPAEVPDAVAALLRAAHLGEGSHD